MTLILISAKCFRIRPFARSIPRRAACQALKETIQFTPLHQCLYPHANTGIFRSLERHSLKRRSMITSLSNSPAINTNIPTETLPVAMRYVAAGFTGSSRMTGTANSASDGYGLREPIHLRIRMKIRFLAIHLAKGVAIVKKTASTMKYAVATTKIADLNMRFTKVTTGLHLRGSCKMQLLLPGWAIRPSSRAEAC